MNIDDIRTRQAAEARVRMAAENGGYSNRSAYLFNLILAKLQNIRETYKFTVNGCAFMSFKEDRKRKGLADQENCLKWVFDGKDEHIIIEAKKKNRVKSRVIVDIKNENEEDLWFWIKKVYIERQY